MGGWNKYDVPEGTKYCPACKNIKALESFVLGRGKTKGRDAYCGPCKVEKQRERRYRMAGKEDPTLLQRYWSKVDKNGPGGCWLWTGALRNGYGVITENGRTIGAHRVALKLAGVTLPASRTDRVVDHTCRVRRCVNPAHLRLVTERVNALENNDSPVAKRARQVTCIRGHPWTRENTSIYIKKKRKTYHGHPARAGQKVRICKACKRERYHRLKHVSP